MKCLVFNKTKTYNSCVLIRSSDMIHSMSKVLHMQKVAISGSAERELLMGNFPMY
ncbi:hypothetical protein T11_4804 [Trichinella zimbabwensis]|uniref:Uncharacterized protein n=1 Tax=Trichinella zimbabwensis TaxID=268475 RepID=A0A0V1GG60_9BILA|nr:hypothetical protein T11_4804 [Trichinella zimbabwensis]